LQLEVEVRSERGFAAVAVVVVLSSFLLADAIAALALCAA